MNQRQTKTLKGQPHHYVAVNGVEVAASWPVFIPKGIFTLVIDGQWIGTMTEAQAIAALDTFAAAN